MLWRPGNGKIALVGTLGVQGSKADRDTVMGKAGAMQSLRAREPVPGTMQGGLAFDRRLDREWRGTAGAGA